MTESRVGNERLRQTWRFVWLLARQRVVDAYRGARLGALWSVLPQFVQIAVLAVILGAVMSHKLGGAAGGEGVPYVVYMLPGVLVWQFFHDTLVQVAEVLPAQRLIVKKNAVALSVLPLYVPIAAAVPFVSGVVVLWGLVSVFWQPVPVAAVGVTLLCALVLGALAYVVGLTWGMVGVVAPDARLALPALLQTGFWLTPIVYPFALIPEALRSWVVWLHPWYGFFAPVQAAWTGMEAAVPWWSMVTMPLGLFLVHLVLLARMCRTGRKVLLDAL